MKTAKQIRQEVEKVSKEIERLVEEEKIAKGADFYAVKASIRAYWMYRNTLYRQLDERGAL